MVEAGDQELVALADEIEDREQHGGIVGARSDRLLGPHHVAAKRLKLGGLARGLCVAKPHVPDPEHL